MTNVQFEALQKTRDWLYWMLDHGYELPNAPLSDIEAAILEATTAKTLGG